MAELHKISVEVTSEQLARLNLAVGAGKYSSTNDILVEALLEWQWNRDFSPEEIIRLKDLWDEGKASGPPQTIDFAQLRVEARERLRLKQLQTASVVD